MSNPLSIDPMTAYQEAQAEADHWKRRAIEHGSQRRALQMVIVKGGPDLDAARARLIEQMGGEQAVAHLMPPEQEPEAAKE